MSQCPACNAEYLEKISKLGNDIAMRGNLNKAVADLQSRVRHLEEENAALKKAITTIFASGKLTS